MNYHLYDPRQPIVVEHPEKKSYFIKKSPKEINHLQELEVEHVVLVDYHPKQYSMVLNLVHHMVFD
jgi:hypothetical protein